MAKVFLTCVAGLASLHLASAACCRNNNCLKAIVLQDSDGTNGIQDCASQLVVTVTPSAVTIFETSTVAETQSQDTTDTYLLTVSETTTATTETLISTTSETVTASTGTDTQTVTQTKAAVTETETQTQSVTASTPDWNLRARQDDQSPMTVPAYASACVSWPQYVAACGCAGVVATTVTLGTSSTTITVDETSTSTVLVESTATSTVFDVLSETATATSTETDFVSVTQSTTNTATEVVTPTTTVSVTVTATAERSYVTSAGPFRVAYPMPPNNHVQDFRIEPITGNPSTGAIEELGYSAASSGYYLFQLDTSGRLCLAANAAGVPSTGGPFCAYVSSNLGGSVQLLYAPLQTIELATTWAFVYGKLDPTTSELFLDAPGLRDPTRTNILNCGGSIFLSAGNGSDLVGGSSCIITHPTIVPFP